MAVPKLYRSFNTRAMAMPGKVFMLALPAVLLLGMLHPSQSASKPMKTRKDPLARFVGKFEGSCIQEVAVVLDPKTGQPVPKCLPQGEGMTLPYFVVYTKLKNGTYHFSWREQTANITDTKGGWYYLPGGEANSTTLHASAAKNSRTAVCISATYSDGSSATFRATVRKVGNTVEYVEEGYYSGSTFGPTNQCPSQDAAPLVCNKKLLGYRCVAWRVA